MEGEEDTFRKLFVGNLLHRTSETGVRDYFLRFGTVAAASVVYDKHGRSRCFGFVTFDNPEAAATACQNQFHIIDGRTVNCNLAAFPDALSQQSSRNRGPRMPFGGAVPHPNSSPFVRSPNYPMYGPAPAPMYGVPPVYPYSQPLGSNQPATSNNPIHGPEPMYGVPPVYPYDQPSASNQPATSNNPMHDPGSVPPVHPYDQASGSNEPVTSNNPMHDPGSVPPVHPHGQASASNEPTNDSPMSDASSSANSSVEEVTTLRLEVYR